MDLDSGEINDLTPIEKIAAQIEGVSEKFPEEILVGINDRGERQYHDIYRMNLLTGEKALLQKNDGFAGFVTDDDYRVRFAVNFTPDGGQVYYLPDDKGEWNKEFMKIDPVDAMTTSLAGFDKTGEKVYLLDSRGDRDTACLKTLDLKSGEEKLLAENDKADISGALAHPTEKNDPGGELHVHQARMAGSRRFHPARPRLPQDRGRRRSCRSPAARSTTSSGPSPFSWITARCGSTCTIARRSRPASCS